MSLVGAAPPPTTGGDTLAAPPAAPNEAIQDAGRYVRARLQISQSIKLLEQALVSLPAGSDEYAAVLSALKGLEPIAGDTNPALVATEMMASGGPGGQAPPPGGGGMRMGGPAPNMPLGRSEAGTYGM